jgi:hypothetical protein
MKVIIGNKAFLIDFKYSKSVSKREYEIIKLKERLKVLESDGKETEEAVRILERNQRMSTCVVLVGNKDTRGECNIVASASVVNHPFEEFTRASGRKIAFNKAMDALFGSPLLLSTLELTETDRKHFETEFKNNTK